MVKKRGAKPRACPRNFATFFIENGWMETKLEFNASTAQVVRWIGECGGDALKAQRKAHYKLKANKQ